MNTRGKVLGRTALKRRVDSLRRRFSIVFTNGCFDVLHAGHVAYLEALKTTGRILVVGMNSDASVRRLKGPGRPVNPQGDRARVLASLACVDFVTIFSEDTPERLIRAVAPDLIAKGADWKGREVVGRDFVESRGGRVIFVRYLPGRSTTEILRRIGEGPRHGGQVAAGRRRQRQPRPRGAAGL